MHAFRTRSGSTAFAEVGCVEVTLVVGDQGQAGRAESSPGGDDAENTRRAVGWATVRAGDLSFVLTQIGHLDKRRYRGAVDRTARHRPGDGDRPLDRCKSARDTPWPYGGRRNGSIRNDPAKSCSWVGRATGRAWLARLSRSRSSTPFGACHAGDAALVGRADPRWVA